MHHLLLPEIKYSNHKCYIETVNVLYYMKIYKNALLNKKHMTRPEKCSQSDRCMDRQCFVYYLFNYFLYYICITFCKVIYIFSLKQKCKCVFTWNAFYNRTISIFVYIFIIYLYLLYLFEYY